MPLRQRLVAIRYSHVRKKPVPHSRIDHAKRQQGLLQGIFGISQRAGILYSETATRDGMEPSAGEKPARRRPVARTKRLRDV